MTSYTPPSPPSGGDTEIDRILEDFYIEQYDEPIYIENLQTGNKAQNKAKAAIQAVVQAEVRRAEHEAQIDVLQRLRGVMGMYKGDGVFDKKLFKLIGKEIHKLRAELEAGSGEAI